MNSQPLKNKLKQHPSKTIPAWQIEKMQNIISARWDEVWEWVQTREVHRKSLNKFN
jgi:hypothetical protein